jgi:hypothetical protein
MKARVIVVVDGQEAWRSNLVTIHADYEAIVKPNRDEFERIYRSLYGNSTLEVRVLPEWVK